MALITFVKNESYKNERGLSYEYTRTGYQEFVEELEERLHLLNKRVSWKNPYDNQAIKAMQSNLYSCLSDMLSGSDSSLSICLSTVDMFGKPMIRLVYNDKRLRRFFLIDMAVRMDSTVSYTLWQRIQYKFFHKKFIYGKYKHYLACYVRVWTSPASYYQFDMGSKRLHCFQNSNMQLAQLGLGLPRGFVVSETLYYERLDYEHRRNLFRSSHGHGRFGLSGC